MARPKLPYVDLISSQGLTTKTSPEILGPETLRIGKNIDLFRTYGALSQIAGSRKLLTNKYAAESNVRVPWVAGYSYPNLDGSPNKQLIAQLGTGIFQINEDGTTTVLQAAEAGLQEDLTRTAAKFDRFMFITGQDFQFIGRRDNIGGNPGTGLKYDGQELTPWGVLAPGSEEIQPIAIAFDDLSGWTTSRTSFALETTTSWNGTSFKCTKDTVGSSFSIVNGTLTPFALNDKIAARGYVYVFFSDLAFGELRGTSTAFHVKLSSVITGSTESVIFEFQVGQLAPGWNRLPLSLIPVPSTETSPPPDYTALVYCQVTFFTVTGSIKTPAEEYFIDHMAMLDQGTPDTAFGNSTTDVLHDGFNAVSTSWTTGLKLDASVADESTETIDAGTTNSMKITKLGQTTIRYVSKQGGESFLATNQYTSENSGAIGTFVSDDGDNPPGATFGQLVLDEVTEGELTGQWVAGEEIRHSDGTLIATVDADVTAVAITSVTNITTTIPRFNFAVGPTLFVGQTVTISGFLDNPTYNITGVIAVTGAGIFEFDVADATFGTSETVGIFDSPAVIVVPITAYVQKGYGASFVLASDSLRNNISIFVTEGDLVKLREVGAIEIKIASNFDATDPDNGFGVASNTQAFLFARSELVDGVWNTLELNTLAGIVNDGKGAGGFDILAVDALRIKMFPDSITATPVIYADKFYTLDETFPAVPFPPASTSSWRYKVTYVTRDGLESNAGPFSVALENTDTIDPIYYEQILLTNIPVSSQSNVVARNIYRTIAGGTTVFFLDTITDNTTTTLTDTFPDTSLGISTPPLEGDLNSLDNSPPPRTGIVHVWKRTVFMAGDPQNPQVLYFSKDDQPESFPLLNAFELDSEITGIFETYLGLVITTADAYWRLIGDNPDFLIDKVVNGFGAVGPKSVGKGRVVGWAIDRDGVRLYDLTNALKISEAIRDKYESLDKENIERMYSVHFKRDNLFLQAFAANGSDLGALDYGTMFAYQYAMDDLRQGWWSTVVPNAAANLNFLAMDEYQDLEGNLFLAAGGDDGQVYSVFENGQTDWVDADGNAQPIEFEVQTPFMRAASVSPGSAGLTSRARPRFVEVAAEELSGLSHVWTVKIDTANGSLDASPVLDTKTLTFNFAAGETLVSLPVPAMTMGTHFRVNVKHAETGRDVVLHRVRSYYQTRAGLRPLPFPQ